MISATAEPTALITGATGFVGLQLIPVLQRAGWAVRAAVRSGSGVRLPEGGEAVVVGDLADALDLRAALAGIDTVIHLAGRVHVMRETAADAEGAFQRANVHVTRYLAEQAADAGVRRFVFLSSVKVNGERTVDRPFGEADRPAPEDAYGRSKWAGEQALHEIAAATGLEVVVIRPPLVYGPGVKANFLRLLRLVDRGVPLPLGSVDNRRSLVGVWNLCDLIVACVGHPAAAGETFLASDQQDLSTPDLIQAIAAALGRPARLFPFPAGVLHWAARIAGQGGAVERLVGSLQVDSAKATRLLGWAPAVSVQVGLARTVEWYVSRRG
jgi:nucleoside-diphosphate-sugar epimerase